MSNESSAPVGMALALGSLTVASHLRISEPAGKSRDRMARAIESLTESLRQDRSHIVDGDLITTFARQVSGSSESERRALLIELTVANPFSPYWFAMTE